MMTTSAPKVFISYSLGDPDASEALVLSLSDRLRQDGVDCFIDQYVNGFPPEGWQVWIEEQIESADFVLVVCTEKYLKRFKRKDSSGGHGVAFEGAIITQTLYDNFQTNTKFIPLIPDNSSIDHVPLMLKSASTYRLGQQYKDLYRVLTNQPRVVAEPIGQLKHYPIEQVAPSIVTTSSKCIYSDRLPTVKGEFFGRKDELKLIADAWAGNGIRIIQFIAAGGTGKTKLIRHWLDTAAPENLIAWSFYSQGSSEDKQTSATPFFSHVFEVLKAEKRLETDFSSPEAKGEYLAQLLHQQRCVLVLDGLEPLQYVGQEERAKLKDRALRALLKNLAGSGTGLCIITTRIAVHELCDRTQVISHDLHNLALPDGVQLLESLGVKGRKKELERAVKEYGCHALALSLLGNLLRIRYQGDVHRRLTLKGLVTTSKTKENQHAFKVMQAYAEYFAGQTELALLSLLGLFDHPIEIEVLRVLWEAQIPALTAGIDEGEWWEAIEALRHEYQLLAERVGGDELDCHPLIREYFGKRLEEGQPEVWRAAHARLYEYYKNLPEKEFPDTLEEMQPLFNAVAHGCRAGLYQKVFDEVYWSRVACRNNSYFLADMGAVNDALTALSNFFDKKWGHIASTLNNRSKANIFRSVGFSLRSLGFIEESLEPFNQEQSYWDELKEPKLYDLVEPNLTLGNIDLAKKIAKSAVSNNYSDFRRELECYAIYIRVLHQSGQNIDLIRKEFEELEHRQIKNRSNFKFLYDLAGFRYGEFLLECQEVNSVIRRSRYFLRRKKSLGTLYIGLNQLLIARSYYMKNNIQLALKYVQQSLNNLYQTGNHDHIPRGLITRAQVYRYNHNYSKAHVDLQEVYDIAEPSGMRLHLTDYHLEMARLLIAEGKEPINKIQEHVDKAEKLINATGYHRRDKELAELKEQLRNWDDE